MILFFDRCIGIRIPKALQRLRLPVEIKYHQQCFPQTEQDDIWLPQVGAWDWIVISQDYKWHKLPNELAVVKQYNIGCFYLAGADAPTWQTMRLFAKSYDKIIGAAGNTPRPFIYWVSKEGRLRLEEVGFSYILEWLETLDYA